MGIHVLLRPLRCLEQLGCGGVAALAAAPLCLLELRVELAQLELGGCLHFGRRLLALLALAQHRRAARRRGACSARNGCGGGDCGGVGGEVGWRAFGEGLVELRLVVVDECLAIAHLLERLGRRLLGLGARLARPRTPPRCLGEHLLLCARAARAARAAARAPAGAELLRECPLLLLRLGVLGLHRRHESLEPRRLDLCRARRLNGHGLLCARLVELALRLAEHGRWHRDCRLVARGTQLGGGRFHLAPKLSLFRQHGLELLCRRLVRALRLLHGALCLRHLRLRALRHLRLLPALREHLGPPLVAPIARPIGTQKGRHVLRAPLLLGHRLRGGGAPASEMGGAVRRVRTRKRGAWPKDETVDVVVAAQQGAPFGRSCVHERVERDVALDVLESIEHREPAAAAAAAAAPAAAAPAAAQPAADVEARLILLHDDLDARDRVLAEERTQRHLVRLAADDEGRQAAPAAERALDGKAKRGLVLRLDAQVHAKRADGLKGLPRACAVDGLEQLRHRSVEDGTESLGARSSRARRRSRVQSRRLRVRLVLLAARVGVPPVPLRERRARAARRLLERRQVERRGAHCCHRSRVRVLEGLDAPAHRHVRGARVRVEARALHLERATQLRLRRGGVSLAGEGALALLALLVPSLLEILELLAEQSRAPAGAVELIKPRLALGVRRLDAAARGRVCLLGVGCLRSGRLRGGARDFGRRARALERGAVCGDCAVGGAPLLLRDGALEVQALARCIGALLRLLEALVEPGALLLVAIELDPHLAQLVVALRVVHLEGLEVGRAQEKRVPALRVLRVLEERGRDRLRVDHRRVLHLVVVKVGELAHFLEGDARVVDRVRARGSRRARAAEPQPHNERRGRRTALECEGVRAPVRDAQLDARRVGAVADEAARRLGAARSARVLVRVAAERHDDRREDRALARPISSHDEVQPRSEGHLKVAVALKVDEAHGQQCSILDIETARAQRDAPGGHRTVVQSDHLRLLRGARGSGQRRGCGRAPRLLGLRRHRRML
eukprot:jgi/Chrpa1/16039/Chrysochromulina_OHIO_Genome00006598-RA